MKQRVPDAYYYRYNRKKPQSPTSNSSNDRQRQDYRAENRSENRTDDRYDALTEQNKAYVRGKQSPIRDQPVLGKRTVTGGLEDLLTPSSSMREVAES